MGLQHYRHELTLCSPFLLHTFLHFYLLLLFHFFSYLHTQTPTQTKQSAAALDKESMKEFEQNVKKEEKR